MRTVLITKLLVFIATGILGAGVAHANLDVSCVLDNCMQEGWQAYNERTGESSLISCQSGDCMQNGWLEEYQNRLVAETTCKPGGCFNEGWRIFNILNGRLLVEVTCLNSYDSDSCLRNGWSTFEVGRGSYLTRCINGDCRNNGWDVLVQGYPPQPVRCKNGGCFTAGWVVQN